MVLFREGKLKKVMQEKTFDVSLLGEAFEHLKPKDHIGKAVISLTNPKSIVKVGDKGSDRKHR